MCYIYIGVSPLGSIMFCRGVLKSRKCSMKNLLCFIAFILLISGQALGQLKVGLDNHVGIGVAPAGNSFLKISKDGVSRLLHLVTESTNSVTGIHNFLRSSTGNKVGLYTELLQNGNYSSIGLNTTLRSKSGQSSYGTKNLVVVEGSGLLYGIFNDVRDEGAVISGNRLVGTFNSIESKFRDQVYGSWVRLRNYGTYDNREVIGFNADLVSYGGSSPNTIGIKAEIPDEPGNFAAYFSGTVQINGSLIQPSDESLKENIEDISNALTLINTLRPKLYSFKSNNRFGVKSTDFHYGFLAQDLEATLPYLVKNIRHPAIYGPVGSEFSNGRITSPEIPADTSSNRSTEQVILHPSESLKGVRYNDFIALLVQAVKEQQVEISTLNDVLGNPLNKSIGRSNKLSLENLQRENAILRADYLVLSDELTALKEQLADLRRCSDCEGISPNTNDVNGARILFYPNPTRSDVTVSTKDLKSFTLQVVSSTGRIVFRGKSKSNSLMIDTSNWAAGTYNFIIRKRTKIIDTRKIVVVK